MLSRISCIFILLPLLFSCTKEAVSNPLFIFKPAPDQTTAAQFGDIKITRDEVRKGVEVDIYEAQMKVHEIEMNRLKTILIEKLIDKDPRKGSMSYDQYLEKFIASKVVVSDAEVMAFAKERSIPEAQLDDRMKERVKRFLEMEKKRTAIDKWLEEKTKTSSVNVFLNQPMRPVFNVQVGDAPFMGGAGAKVTVVEFSDFQCPFCAKGADIMNGLKKAYGDKIKIAFKQFPLPFHKDAKLASQAALCAFEQKKEAFWKMHDMMFADQQKLKMDDLVTKAGKAGVDGNKVKDCLSKNKYLAKVEADIKQGKELGVKSTPTFFVNGMIVNGAQPLEVFKKLIDEQLAK